MKNISKVKSIVLIMLIAFCVACNTSGKKVNKTVDKDTVSMIEVSISGMSCAGCEQSVQKGVAKLDGIKSVKALSTIGKAFVEYSPAVVDTAKIREAINSAGYTVTKIAEMPVSEPVK
jgi:mercuric ion transport protein